MASLPYNLRSRLDSPATIKSPGNSSLPRPSTRSPKKANALDISLRLKHVVGTTTSNPSGLSCCSLTNSYTYCAGAVAVLAHVQSDASVSHRYYKARPTARAVHPSSSYYDSPSSTPTRKKSVVPAGGRIEDTQYGLSGRDWLEESSTQTWTARERIKAVTSVSLSPDGRLLAVGETGYNPRVLLFSTSDSASTEVPLSIMTEHSFGVISVAFSSDSKYLATLGDVNDGFLYIWAVNSKTGTAKLQLINKCTTNVCHIAWCGTTLITAGTRHVKLWYVSDAEKSMNGSKCPRLRTSINPTASPGPHPLQGRNCLLGGLVNATFTCVVALSDSHALICTDDGQLCQLDVSKSPAELVPVCTTETPIDVLGLHPRQDKVVWADNSGNLQEREVDMLLSDNSNEDRPSTAPDRRGIRRKSLRASYLQQSSTLVSSHKPKTIALGCLDNYTVSIDADANLIVGSNDTDGIRKHVYRSSCHNDLVKGVQILPASAKSGAFLTWSKSGEVRFWDGSAALLRTEMVDLDDSPNLEESTSNELKIVRYNERNHFICGDRFGVLKVIKDEMWTTLSTIRAHSAEITDIAVLDSGSLVATCARDRMIQIFRFTVGMLELLQTLDDHIGAVIQMIFMQDGEKLLSCSNDRTVVIRERYQRKDHTTNAVAYIQTRIITLKSSPLSICSNFNDKDILFVSTLDRHVLKIDATTGTTIDSFKVSDPDTDDTVNLNSICLAQHQIGGNNQLRMIAGFSAIDKSIRVYDSDKGGLLGREAGHTEGISDAAMLSETSEEGSTQHTIVSTGFDGTIMLWTIVKETPQGFTPVNEQCQSQVVSGSVSDSSPVKASPVSLPPLRKILTKVDIADFGYRSPSLSPSRDSSPGRLRRRTSRLALSTKAIEEADENDSTTIKPKTRDGVEHAGTRKSPSPTRRNPVRTNRLQSRTESNKTPESSRNDRLKQSPSPSSNFTIEASTLKKLQRANNGRLRRPPSMPTDLRAQALAQGRRQSLTIAGDFGSIETATDQTCRVLKSYGKKLDSCAEQPDLGKIEHELENVLKLVRVKRHEKPKNANNENSKPDLEDDDNESPIAKELANELTVLLERTNLND